MDNENQSSYRTVVKGTAIFGGVQVFNILLNIVRGKLVALLLGPAGMGVASLFTSTASTITQFSSFGLNLSAVKKISELAENGDQEKLNKTVAVFRKLVLFSGMLAALISLAGAPWLSKFTFGNENYTWEFALLSLMLFFTINNMAETALLQGTRKLNFLAVSTVIGAATGLVAGVPLYYFFGVEGIVPAMVILSIVSYLVSRRFTSKLRLSTPSVGIKEVFHEGGQMLSLGIMLMLTSLISMIALYAINVYIRKHGGLDDVGFYQAAAAMTNQYVGLIFSSMSVDYFPRLSAISGNPEKVRKTVFQQMEIVMLIVAPMLIAVIIMAPWIIRLLLIAKFLPIIPLLRWLAIGTFFKAMAFPLGYISFSKGDKKVFFMLEGVYVNTANIILSILGYKLGGLIGLGVAYAATNIFYMLILSVVTRFRYGITLDKNVLKIMIPLFVLLALSFTIFLLDISVILTYTISAFTLLVSLVFSYKMLDKRVEIKKMILSKIKKQEPEV